MLSERKRRTTDGKPAELARFKPEGDGRRRLQYQRCIPSALGHYAFQAPGVRERATGLISRTQTSKATKAADIKAQRICFHRLLTYSSTKKTCPNAPTTSTSEYRMRDMPRLIGQP